MDDPLLLSDAGFVGGFGLFELFYIFGFVSSGSFGRKKKAVQQDKEKDVTDILTSEGEEGWLEKILKKVKYPREPLHLHLQKWLDSETNQLFHQNVNLESRGD